MAGYDSNIMLNIVPIFNTASADGNIDTTNAITNAITALQTIIDTTSQTITANTIRTFNSATLEILNDTNITGTLTVNNKSVFDIGGSNFNVSTANLSISTGAIGLFLVSTPLINNEIGGFQLYSSNVFSIDTNNNFVFQPFNNALVSTAIVRISTLPLVVDTANISSLNLNSLSVSKSSIFNTIYSSSISVTGNARLPILSTIFINASHIRTSSIEVLNTVKNLVVDTANISSLNLNSLSVTKSSIFNTIYSSSISITGNARLPILSTIFMNTSHIRTSSIEVLNPIINLVVSSMNTSTTTSGLINLNDSFNHRINQVYSYNNILYFNKQPIGGTLSYSFETISF